MNRSYGKKTKHIREHKQVISQNHQQKDILIFSVKGVKKSFTQSSPSLYSYINITNKYSNEYSKGEKDYIPLYVVVHCLVSGRL